MTTKTLAAILMVALALGAAGCGKKADLKQPGGDKPPRQYPAP